MTDHPTPSTVQPLTVSNSLLLRRHVSASTARTDSTELSNSMTLARPTNAGFLIQKRSAVCSRPWRIYIVGEPHLPTPQFFLLYFTIGLPILLSTGRRLTVGSLIWAGQLDFLTLISWLNVLLCRDINMDHWSTGMKRLPI